MPWADSESEVTSLGLLGVWIFDPEVGAESSVRVYLYGSSQREDSLDAMGAPGYYAGREFPVMDYGEHSSISVSVTVDIPRGESYFQDLEDLIAFAASKRTLHYRDNRGRSMYVTLDGMRRKDTSWGTQVSFTATRAHRDIEMITL